MERYITSDLSECLRIVEECLGGHEGLIINVADSFFVETGSFPTFDRMRCEELQIPVGRARYHGGSIVCFPGDLSLCEIHWGTSDFAPQVIEKTVDLLENYGLEVTRDGNDVLADGKKVASWARATTVEGWCQSVVHFSVNVDLDLIRQICTKPMVKLPGALSEYGISADDILSALKDAHLL